MPSGVQSVIRKIGHGDAIANRTWISMVSSSRMSFTLPQRLLHWGVALLIFFNLLFPDGMNAWHRIIRRGGVSTPEDVASANVHAYVGIAILALACLRFVFRFVQGVPAAPADQPPLFALMAKLTHVGLYALIFAMPLTGIAAYYFGADTLGSLHADVLKVILWILIAAHAAGALAQHFLWRTDVLRRMTIG